MGSQIALQAQLAAGRATRGTWTCALSRRRPPLQGVVFCVATDAGILKLYDVRNPKQGPFSTFTVRNPASSLHTTDCWETPAAGVLAWAVTCTPLPASEACGRL